MNINFKRGVIYLCLMMLTSVSITHLIFDARDAAGVVIFTLTALSIPAITIPGARYNYLIIAALLFSAIYTFYCINFFNIFPGIDAVRYYNFLLSNNSLGEILSGAVARMATMHENSMTEGPGSFFIFGVPVQIFYSLMPAKDPFYIVIFNCMFKLMSIAAMSRLFSNVSSVDFRCVLISLIIVSPTFNYFSSVFGKDIFILFLTILLALALVDFCKTQGKVMRLLKAVVILMLAGYCFLLRPYSPVTALLYVVFTLEYYRAMKFITLGAFFILMLAAFFKSILLIINWPMIFAFMYMAPNPAQWMNYEGFTLLPALCVIVTLVLLIIRTIKYTTLILDSRLMSSIMCVLIYSAVMTLVGFYAIRTDYTFGSVGDAVFRKQLLIMPLVIFSILLYLRTYASGTSDEEN